MRSFPSFKILYLALSLIFIPSITLANSQDPEQARIFSNDFINTGLAILNNDTLSQQNKAKQLEAILKNKISKKVPALVLGASYRQITKPQQERYSKALIAFAEFSIATKMAIVKNANIEIVEIRPAKRGFNVFMQASVAGESPLDLSLRLVCESDGLRILDISVENISLVLTQKAEATAIYASQGIDGLIATLESRTP